jgi:hypothetical protein
MDPPYGRAEPERYNLPKLNLFQIRNVVNWNDGQYQCGQYHRQNLVRVLLYLLGSALP